MNIKALMRGFQSWQTGVGLDKKKHQTEGMEWVLNRELNPTVGPKGGFVCDEMGLGKTILMLGAIVADIQRGVANAKNLIVLPLALLEQWHGAIKKFLAHDALVYHGYNKKNIDLDDLNTASIVLTTYGMVSTRKDEKYTSLLWKVNWNRIVYDEAHHMRNCKSRTYQGALRLNANIKWLVTGTPINNGENDFWNLCSIIGLDRVFRGATTVPEIRAIIRQCLLKRTKAQVGIKMPELTVHRVPVHFESDSEEKMARNVHNLMGFTPVTPQNVDVVIRNLARGDDGFASVLPIFMLMRQVCVMPNLATSLLKRRAIKRRLDLPPFTIVEPSTNSKISAVVNQVVANRNTHKKKLIFCQFRNEIREIQKRLSDHGMSSSIMDGSTSKMERKTVLQSPLKLEDWDNILMSKQFYFYTHLIGGLVNKWLTPNVLIVQIQTACEGLNLQHFAEVYFTTPHWNPAVEDQAVARTHRIGQKQPVDVYRFITHFSEVDNTDVRNMSLDQYCSMVQDMKRETMKMID